MAELKDQSAKFGSSNTSGEDTKWWTSGARGICEYEYTMSRRSAFFLYGGQQPLKDVEVCLQNEL